MAQGGPPVITDDPETPGNGNWEINMAGQGQISQFQDVIQAPYLDINYGLGDSVQLKLEGGFVTFVDADQIKSGGTAAELGIKWRFLDLERKRFAMSIYPQVSFNYFLSNPDEDLNEPGTTLFLPLEFAKHWGGWALNPEVGYLISGVASDQVVWGIVVAYKWLGDYELLAEIHDAYRVDQEDTEYLFNVGTRLPLSKTLTFLGSAGSTMTNFNGDTQQFLFYVGLQLHFEQDEPAQPRPVMPPRNQRKM